MASASQAWLPPRGTHNITIGSSIRRSLSNDHSAQAHPPQPSRNDFVAMRYNLKPPGVANAAGSLASSGSYSNNKETYQLELSSETGERHSFTARSETKKEVDCVLFYDAATGTLVLERLDSLLSLTHQRTPSSNSQNINNGHLNNRASPTVPATIVPATAFPPTPPSTSPPEYTALPESIRPVVRDTPRKHHADHQSTQPADKEPESLPKTSIGTLNAYASSTNADTPASAASSSTSSSRKKTQTPQSMSDYAQVQRRLHESRPFLPKRSTSDFTSEPDEEILTFGKPAAAPAVAVSAESSSPSNAMPSSNNALRLSDIPSRRAKRKFSDSEPDEEVLEFGRPAQEIKRAKTSSPASVGHGTPAANAVAESPNESTLSPHSRPLPYQSIPLRSSAAYATKMVHGSSPLATATVLSSNSSDDDSDDSDLEEVMPSFMPDSTIATQEPGGEADADEDDFLAAAFNEDDEMTGLQDDAASNHSDDSSDESDYDER